MYCKNCGKPVGDDLTFCPNCGVAIGQTAQAAPPVQDDSNGIAVAGFVLSFFIGIAGLICCIIGCRRAAKRSGNGRSLSIAGIVISSIHITAAIVIVLFYAAAVLSILAIAAAWGAG